MVVERFPGPDEVFQDRYLILSEINRGGFGRVYRAQQVELKRDVAIKVLQPVRREGMDADEEQHRLEVVAKRFEREAQLVSQLRDSHTVMMHDYGTTKAGLLYMVLEFIDGRALDEVIAQEGAMEADRVVKIAQQVLSSLEEAHHLNMLHRDIKPANIMLFDHAGRTDQVKVLDFGLAKSVESGDFRAENPDLTGEEVILGTPRYMSPEQIRGDGIGPSTDIYSLGLVMYEMLTGQKAVTGDSTMTTLARHLNNIPIRLPDDADVPDGLRQIVDRMLLKPADQRVESAAVAMRLLSQWDSVGGVTDPSIESAAGVNPILDNERQKQFLLYVGAAIMALFLMIGIISAVGGRDVDGDETDGDGIATEANVENENEHENAETELAAGIKAPDEDVADQPIDDLAASPVVGDDIAVQTGPPAEQDTNEVPPPERIDEPDDGFEFGGETEAAAAATNNSPDEQPPAEARVDDAPAESSKATSVKTPSETKSTNRQKSGNKKKSTGLKLRTLK